MTRPEIAEALQLVEYGLSSLATGYLPGIHKGAFHGTAGKLAGFTSLLHRMDPRNIDPVVTRRALSPVPLVRLYQAKVAITVGVCVDVSASMGFVGRGRKMAEAAKLTAALAYSAHRLGDRFTCIGFGDEVELFFPPKRSGDYPAEVAGALWRQRPRGRGVGALDEACALLPRRRSLVFLVSDFHFDPALLDRALAHLRRHETVVVALWDSAEDEAPARWGWTELYDPETGARTRRWLRRGIVPRARETFAALRGRITASCRRFGASALFVRDALDPLDLTRFFLSGRG